MTLSDWLILVQLAQFPVLTMNELPAIGYPCYTQTLGSPGGKHRKPLERNVSRNVVSTSEKRILEKEQHSFFRQCFIASGFGQCCYVENVSFCLTNREIFDKIYRPTSFFCKQYATTCIYARRYPPYARLPYCVRK